LIKRQAANYPVAAQCRVLAVSRSGYQAWCSRGASRRAQRDQQLLKAIEHAHREYREAFGAVKLWRVLNAGGIACGKHRVARLRRQAGISTKRRRRQQRKLRYQFTRPAAPDLLQQHFGATQPNQVWAGDMTFIRTREGWLHLAVLLDLHSRKVIGWAMDHRPGQEVHVGALTMALSMRRPAPGLIHHTDRGIQYRTRAYTNLLERHGVRASMTGRAVPQDNAVAESFFSSLKNELIHHCSFGTRQEARTAVFLYIEGFYNRQRIHQGLGYRIPEHVDREGCVSYLNSPRIPG
jgi:transposase InsO family protein